MMLQRMKQFKKRVVPLAVFVFVLFSVFAADVWAQNSSADVKNSATAVGTKKEKKTALNFEDELVDGQTTKPELFYLFQKKNFNYKRLIRLRENFLPEMRKTSEDIQRSKGAN